MMTLLILVEGNGEEQPANSAGTNIPCSHASMEVD